MRFQVPQFIEVEDKIFGPLTFKQFIYLLGGAGLSYIIYRFVPLYIGFVLIALVVSFSVALAFYRVNNKPFIDLIQAMLRYFTRSRFFLWKKQPKKDADAQTSDRPADRRGSSVPRISESRLKDITWNLEIEDTAKKRDDNERDTLNP